MPVTLFDVFPRRCPVCGVQLDPPPVLCPTCGCALVEDAPGQLWCCRCSERREVKG